MSTLWSSEEISILRAHYPHEGYLWAGWESLLPGRTCEAIRHKALSMGIEMDDFPVEVEMPRRKLNKYRMHIEDESEQRILTYMESGYTMEQVDKMCGWRPGLSKKILVEMWRRENSDLVDPY